MKNPDSNPLLPVVVSSSYNDILRIDLCFENMTNQQTNLMLLLNKKPSRSYELLP